ncbi:MAG TPA: peptidogalycan biosysnthesis protein [Steroidobacteraceae bacterium]|nr:peptidogalycan biosysnthesis protein [Steroidobacteraceae bacterium]HRX88487.1 peptidogalycan biosysnthesis protein [Steroidobacteraceae bacterium]
MQATVHASIGELDRDAWNSLDSTNNPFLRHEFLLALESEGCVGQESGWTPAIVALHDYKGLAAAAPAYVKDHSYGEFVFDFAWAQAYARLGLSYYPKLVVGVPFTPASGARLLLREPASDELRSGLIAALQHAALARGWSSIHALFATDSDQAALQQAGWLARRDVQFHWHNRGYRSFDDYLATFTADKRKKARRERRRVAEGGIEFATLTGPDIARDILDAVYALHRNTFLRHGHQPYLSRGFFRAIPALLGEQFMLKLATRKGHLAAAAVFFWHQDALFGRYWGAADEFHSLHFETCYHQGIEFCIEHGIQRFEPGTQGEHKVSRGFEPTLTRSAHWIADRRFRDAIADYLERESTHVDAYATAVRAHVPYRDVRSVARALDPTCPDSANE